MLTTGSCLVDLIEKHREEEKYGFYRLRKGLHEEMYHEGVTIIGSPIEETSEVPITWLNQGSFGRPYRCSLVLDELTRHIQDDVSWCML